MNLTYIAKLALLFIIFYIVLYFLPYIPNIGITAWANNPMYWLMPIPGFFFMFIATDWIDAYLGIKFAKTPFFPLAFVIAGFISYWIVLYWYLGNIAQLNNQPVVFDYWERLRSSAFLIFIFSGLFGWVSKFVMDKISK